MIRPRIPKRWCRFRIRISATVAGRWGSVGGGRVRSPRWLPALSSDGCRTISCQQLSSLATRGHRVLRQAMVEQGRLLYQQPRPTLMFDETRPPSFRPLFGKRAQPPGRPGLRRLDPSNVGDRARSRRRALGGPIGLIIGGRFVEGRLLASLPHTAWAPRPVLGILPRLQPTWSQAAAPKIESCLGGQSKGLRPCDQLSQQCLTRLSQLPLRTCRSQGLNPWIDPVDIAHGLVRIWIANHWAATAQVCPATACKEIQPWQATHPWIPRAHRQPTPTDRDR
jgi:hypothetical protein